MSNLAIDLTPLTVIQEFGVLEAGADELVVRSRSGVFPVRRALSCLIEPIVGDRVLIAIDNVGPVYILAVVERTTGGPSRMIFDGDAEVFAPGGAIELVARDGISIASPRSVELSANELRINAVEAALALERTTFSGAFLSACMDRVKLAANSIDAIMDRWSQRVRQSLRRVEELDQLKAGQIDHSARETLALHGNNTLVSANKLVSVDAQQIHLG